MPLPFILGALAVAGAAALAHHVGKKSGYNKGYDTGYHTGNEESSARINQLMKKLAELQAEREDVKDKFSEVVESIGNLDTKDAGFFAKIGALLRGYTNFHAFVVAVISYARYRVLEISLDAASATELRNIVLGLIQGGFPKNLKADVNNVWGTRQKGVAGAEMEKYRKKLKGELLLEFSSVCDQIDDIVKGLKEISTKEKEVQKELAILKAS